LKFSGEVPINTDGSVSAWALPSDDPNVETINLTKAEIHSTFGSASINMDTNGAILIKNSGVTVYSNSLNSAPDLISIRAAKLNLTEKSFLRTFPGNYGSGSGNINVDATDAFILQGGSFLTTSVPSNVAPIGKVSVKAGSVLIDGTVPPTDPVTGRAIPAIDTTLTLPSAYSGDSPPPSILWATSH
jgi:hypothetical protein